MSIIIFIGCLVLAIMVILAFLTGNIFLMWIAASIAVIVILLILLLRKEKLETKQDKCVCPKCGKPVTKEKTFCTNCGEKVN